MEILDERIGAYVACYTSLALKVQMAVYKGLASYFKDIQFTAEAIT